MIRFRLFDSQCPDLIAFAKSQSRRLIAMGMKSFTKKWTLGSSYVTARAVSIANDVQVTIKSFKAAVANRLLFNHFDFSSPLTPSGFSFAAASATTPASKKIEPVRLTALGPATSEFGSSLLFTRTEVTDGFGFGPPSLTPGIFFQNLRRNVNAGDKSGARLWLNLFGHVFTDVQYKGATVPHNTSELIISEPVDGDFRILIGDWLIDYDVSTGDPVPADPNVPRRVFFSGFSMKLSELETVVTGSVISLDYDPLTKPPTFEGPHFIGNIRKFDPTTGGVMFVASGEVVERKELGFFPPVTSHSAIYSITPRYHNYRPTEFGSSFAHVFIRVADGSPFAIPYFTRFDQGDVARQTVVHEFKLYKLSATGSLIITDVPRPDCPVVTQTISNFGFGVLDSHLSGWTNVPIVFFDGEKFVQIGRQSGEASFLTDTGFGGGDAAYFGSISKECSLPVGEFSDAIESDFDYFRDFDFICYGENRDHILPGSAFGVYTFTAFRAETLNAFSEGQFNSLFGVYGPVYGERIVSGPTLTLREQGFTVAGYELPSPFDVPFASNAIGRITIQTRVTPRNGVMWYRPGGNGLFMYSERVAGVSFTAIAADSDKYRHVANKDVGYRRIDNGDGTFTDEPNYEDPEVILTRIRSNVTIVVNNFGTTELVPWFSSDGLFSRMNGLARHCVIPM